MRRSLLILAVLALVAAAVLLSPRATHHASPVAQPVAKSAAPPMAQTRASMSGAPTVPSDVTHPDIGFRRPEFLTEHFHKHGGELNARDEADYLAMAQSLRDRPAGGMVLEAKRPDGVITRFDRATGAFLAFNADLTIRTFFRPNDGEAYFRRQLERAH